MLETQMSIPATIKKGTNSGIGFAYSATSREDAENDSKVFGLSSIPFKDVAIPSGTPNVNFSTTNQNYNGFIIKAQVYLQIGMMKENLILDL